MICAAIPVSFQIHKTVIPCICFFENAAGNGDAADPVAAVDAVMPVDVDAVFAALFASWWLLPGSAPGNRNPAETDCLLAPMNISISNRSASLLGLRY